MENRVPQIEQSFEQELDEMIRSEIGDSFSDRSEQIINNLEKNRRKDLLKTYYGVRNLMLNGKINTKQFGRIIQKFDNVQISEDETMLALVKHDLFPRELSKFEQKQAYERVDEIELTGIGEPGMDDFVVLPDGTIYCWNTAKFIAYFKKINPDGSTLESKPGITPMRHVKYIGDDKFMFIVGNSELRVFDINIPEETTVVYEKQGPTIAEIEDFAVLPNGELIIVRTEGLIESVDLTNFDKKKPKTRVIYPGLTWKFSRPETFHRVAIDANGEIIINSDMDSLTHFSKSEKDRGGYKKKNIANELRVIMLENFNGKGLSYESPHNLCLRSLGTNSMIEMPGIVDMQPLTDNRALVAQAGMDNQALKIVNFNSRVVSLVSDQVVIDWNAMRPRVCQATADGKIYLIEAGWKLLVFDGESK